MSMTTIKQVEAIRETLGDDLYEVFAASSGLALTGGYLARLSCDLYVGEDVDVLCEVDAYSKLRTALYAAGYELCDSESSTGFREARGIADDQVMFRQKWKHESRVSIDCLVLNVNPDATLHPEIANMPNGDRATWVFHKEALKFIDTYDCRIVQQLVVWDLGVPVWFFTLGAMLAVRNREPGWIDGRFTYDERREKWNKLLF